MTSLEKPGPLCERCPLKEQPYIAGHGAAGSVLVVGECPGQTDAEKGDTDLLEQC